MSGHAWRFTFHDGIALAFMECTPFREVEVIHKHVHLLEMAHQSVSNVYPPITEFNINRIEAKVLAQNILHQELALVERHRLHVRMCSQAAKSHAIRWH
jgi:hypothetical protein